MVAVQLLLVSWREKMERVKERLWGKSLFLTKINLSVIQRIKSTL